jgi:hypothetical protein
MNTVDAVKLPVAAPARNMVNQSLRDGWHYRRIQHRFTLRLPDDFSRCLAANRGQIPLRATWQIFCGTSVLLEDRNKTKCALITLGIFIGLPRARAVVSAPPDDENQRLTNRLLRDRYIRVARLSPISV